MKTNRSRKDDMVEEFQEAYDDALAEVRKAAETTATDGWQQMYCAFIKSNKDARESAADLLDQQSTALRQKPIDGDGVKELKGAVKDATDACEQAAFFDAQTVGPIRGTVEKCHMLISEFEGRAEAASQSTPLTDGDVAQRMSEAILSVPKATWNASVGFIRIVEGRA